MALCGNFDQFISIHSNASGNVLGKQPLRTCNSSFPDLINSLPIPLRIPPHMVDMTTLENLTLRFVPTPQPISNMVLDMLCRDQDIVLSIHEQTGTILTHPLVIEEQSVAELWRGLATDDKVKQMDENEEANAQSLCHEKWPGKLGRWAHCHCVGPAFEV